MARRNTYRQGEHICAIFETEDEQLAMAAEYLADGLQAGERVLYVASSDEALQRFRGALEATGVDLASVLKRGALVQSTHGQAHLAGGGFDSERMLTLLNDAMELALTDGFAGLRTCGDMSWLLHDVNGAHHVLHYEAMLNEFFHRGRGCGMCQYDRRHIPPFLLDHALATHSSVLLDCAHLPNTFYEPPAKARQRKAAPSRVDWKLTQLRQTS